MRTLGIDFGERRIGLAISDAEGRFALPLGTLERTDDRGAIAALLALVRERDIEALVMGVPLAPQDGAETAAARRVRRFGERLGRAGGLPVEWIDETLTTVEAASRLREAGAAPARLGAALDSVAAQIVLQEALDRRARRNPAW